MAFDDLAPQPPVYPPEAEAYTVSALEMSRDAAGRTRHVADIAYGDDDRQKVDVYQPDDKDLEGLPVLLFAHGGGYTNGYKEWMGLMAPAVVAFPAIFVAVSYRLAPDNRFPVPVDDCRAALAWAHGHIADYGGDPDRIFVGGHSAGGHMYSLVTLRRDLLRASGLPEDVVKGCLPVSSQLNLRFENPESESGEARIYEVFFAAPTDDVAASPLHHAVGNTTPFVLAYGTRDFPRIIRSNMEMAAILDDQPCASECQIYEGYDHFAMALSLAEPGHRWMKTVRKWMTEGVPET